MTDNLIEIDNLKSQIIAEELISKTQRCGIVWDQLPNLAYHTNFFWAGQWYDIYLTPMQNNKIVADMVINGRNVLSVNSYVYSQVQDLYEAVSDVINTDPVIQILQDLNATSECQSRVPIVASGGLRTGGTAKYLAPNRYNEIGSGGMVTGGSANSMGSLLGFDAGVWNISTCLPSVGYVQNLAADLSLLSSCRLVFAGPRPAVNDVIINKFTRDQVAIIKQWIIGGGRFWLNTEFEDFVVGEFGNQVSSIALFLGDVGSTMAWGGGSFDPSDNSPLFATPGVANVSQGLTFLMQDSARITGGTSVWLTPTDQVQMVAVEQIGNGFLFLCGDSNVLGDDNFTGEPGDPVPSTEFVGRLYNYTNDQIIGGVGMSQLSFANVDGAVSGGTAVVSGGTMMFGTVNHVLATPTSNNLLYMSLSNKIQLLSNSGSISDFYINLQNIDDVESDGDLIFWSQSTMNNGLGTGIYCCDSNATNKRQLFYSPVYSSITDIALDKQNRQIYFLIDRVNNGQIVEYFVMKISYDGGDPITLVRSNNAYLSQSIDLGAGYMFWCDNHGITDGYVMRANLDGSNVSEMLLTNGHIRSVCVHGSDVYLGGVGLLARADVQGDKLLYLPTEGFSIIDDICINSNNLYLNDIGVNAVIQTDLGGNNPKRITIDSITRTGICLVGV